MKIGIIGCGSMGGSMAKRLAKDHTVSLYDPHPEKMAAIPGAKACTTSEEAIRDADLVILAVKPKHLEEAASKITLNGKQILVSVLGSASLADLARAFGEIPIVRAMPNLPVEIGEGVIGLTADDLKEEEKKAVNTALAPLGTLQWTTEPMINAIGAIAGSGPGLLAIVVESMIDAGVAMGLSAPVARDLALQTIGGTASYLQESGLSPSEFKWKVASPGGSTIAGIQELETEGVRGGIINAFLAVYQK